MIWVCSACGLENATQTFFCKECGNEYGKHQNSSIRIKMRSLKGTLTQVFPLSTITDDRGVDWNKPVEPAAGQLAPIQGVPIPFSVKIATAIAVVCMIFSVLLILR